MTIDKLTKRWIRNASDERAAAAGYRFDEGRGEHVVRFVTENLRLYEGEQAGQLVSLIPWEYDCFMRIYSWVRFDPDWDRKTRRFRMASVWIPKKNGKSPFAAMNGLYLLCADGEQGQKVFSAAKDGQQAGIMHTHAIKMVEQSETLTAVCNINKSSGRIIHVPTDSYYSILAADNISGQEGRNGSMIIDETHVVSKRLEEVIEGAGASRSEPLQLEVSTVGSDPQSYGRKQYDYGKRIESGQGEPDHQFFFASWEAPQDATDAQCCDIDIQKVANPSWGYIIKEGEFTAACIKAQRSITDFARFKQRRLNIWQESSNPWLKREDWQKCRTDWTFESFHGQSCWAGLDLSKTRDMTALVLVFKDEIEEDTYYQFPFFWLPENTAKKNKHLADYVQWEADGFLYYCDHDTIDQRDIYRKIEELDKVVTIEQLGYDERYANELTQTIEEDLRIERVKIGQNPANLVGAIGDYERLVIAGRLHHNDHPVLTWQSGHVQKNPKNGLLVKPEHQDHRKIDGMDAGVMALKLAMGAKTRESVYNTRGLAVSG